MARNTSITAYNTICDNKLLSLRRMEVYDYLFRNGPCTAKQVTNGLISPGQNSGGYTTRLSELKRMGVVDEVGETKCQETGQTVLLWDVNDRLPKKLDKQQVISRKHLTRCREVLLKIYHNFPNLRELIIKEMGDYVNIKKQEGDVAEKT